MKRAALVTGGAGFIGSALTRLLLRKLYDVTVLDDLSFGRRRHIWPGVRFIKGDIRSAGALKTALDRPYSRIFHLAALHFIPYCNRHPLETISVNIGGTQMLLEALTKRPPERLFFASTAAVYDMSSRHHRVDELPEPMDIYGISKLAGEHLVRNFHEVTGARVVIGRLFNAYGPRETNEHLVPCIVKQLKTGARTIGLGNLRPYRDFIHTDDLAEAVTLLTDKTAARYTLANLTSREEFSVREVIAVFSRLLGRKLRIESRPALRRKQERLHLRGDLSEIRRIAGWVPRIRFVEGVRDLLIHERVLKP